MSREGRCLMSFFFFFLFSFLPSYPLFLFKLSSMTLFLLGARWSQDSNILLSCVTPSSRLPMTKIEWGCLHRFRIDGGLYNLLFTPLRSVTPNREWSSVLLSSLFHKKLRDRRPSLPLPHLASTTLRRIWAKISFELRKFRKRQLTARTYYRLT